MIVGEALKIPLGVWFRTFFRSEHVAARSLLACEIVLLCMVPFALRLNREIGLPGAPFLRARLARQKAPGRFRGLIAVALLYDLASLGIEAVALVLLVLSGARPLATTAGATHTGSHLLRSDPFIPMEQHVGRFGVAGILAALGAGLSEEIIFRLSAFAIFIWLIRTVQPKPSIPPSKTTLWCATLLQGYAFGLPHLILRSKALPKLRLPIWIAGLMAPQTWAGVVLGRLYLKRGLEATMIAHAMMDLGMFLFLTIIVHLLHQFHVAQEISHGAALLGYL